jgi:hypothetical protein
MRKVSLWAQLTLCVYCVSLIAARQRLGKAVPTPTNTLTIIEEFWRLALYADHVVPKERYPTSRQRGQTLAWLRWRGPATTVNYRPVLSSERALQHNKQELSIRKSQGGRKIVRGSRMGAWHQDGLADWLSVVMWLWLWQRNVADNSSIKLV